MGCVKWIWGAVQNETVNVLCDLHAFLFAYQYKK